MGSRRCAPRPHLLKRHCDLSRRTVHAGRRGAPSWRCRTPAPAGATIRARRAAMTEAGCACPVPGAGAPVVFLGKRSKALLRAPAGFRRRGRGFLQGAVHALVAAVLLRMPAWIRCARMPADPPHRQPRQPGRRAGGEGRTVIVRMAGQPVTRGTRLRRSPAPARCRLLHRLAAQQIALEVSQMVSDRCALHRRCAASLEVSRPLVVGSPADANGCV